MRVTNDDPRYDEWLTAAAMRTEKKRRTRERQQLAKAAVSLAGGSRGVSRSAAAAVGAARGKAKTLAERAGNAASALRAARIPVGVGAGAVGVGTAAALAILAGVASYYGTTWALKELRGIFDPDERAFRLAKAYREARRAAEKQLGRQLTAEEVKALGADLNRYLVQHGKRG